SGGRKSGISSHYPSCLCRRDITQSVASCKGRKRRAVEGAAERGKNVHQHVKAAVTFEQALCIRKVTVRRYYLSSSPSERNHAHQPLDKSGAGARSSVRGRAIAPATALSNPKCAGLRRGPETALLESASPDR